ncbi:hypothetical protein M404DRAFT_646133 [Pisolithus tinctorius Marx 270]|uniref:Uncharacterized protein n=1 Tax=Pisolithus tinctorius Marx 270 TaxID=870435 RepID=A0A0C3JZI4_PISTI|nr:hypothetical protein M404DRAFT_646133 [Pisolithus tinctorius Marx 270]
MAFRHTYRLRHTKTRVPHSKARYTHVVRQQLQINLHSTPPLVSQDAVDICIFLLQGGTLANLRVIEQPWQSGMAFYLYRLTT